MSGQRGGRIEISQERACDILRAPVVTEKSTMGSEHNQVTFKVMPSASKPEIRAAVELLFNVKVRSINTLRQKGKVKRFRGVRGKRPDYKKAIVCLEEGQSIDVTSGI